MASGLQYCELQKSWKKLFEIRNYKAIFVEMKSGRYGAE